ncbi:MAG: hypothetical protein MUO77_04935 [Anaerolineales bacterium]|nr:hypothetical protein [Anaerolineales bacterium]
MDIKKVALRQRLLGIFPLIFFMARLIELTGRGEIAHILWVCHISNLLIAVGLFLGYIELVRVSVLWLMIGAPLWPIDIIRAGIMDVTSIGTHYAGLVVGLLVLGQPVMGKRSWLYALIWFLSLQQLARMFTPAEFNINIAHSIYPGWEQFFSAYWQYWIFIILGSAISLWLISHALSWIFGKSKSLKHG